MKNKNDKFGFNNIMLDFKRSNECTESFPKKKTKFRCNWYISMVISQNFFLLEILYKKKVVKKRENIWNNNFR